MRIVENSPSQLVLRDRTPWVAFLLIAVGGMQILATALQAAFWSLGSGLVFVAMGVAFLRSNRVAFDKDRRICAVSRFDTFRRTRRELAFDDITDLRIEPSPRRTGIAMMSCRFSLVTVQGPIPLTASYEPGPERYRIMRDEVLDFLFAQRPRPANATGL